MGIRIICYLLFSAALASAAQWKAITPEMLALKTPKLDPNADAEAIFWEARVNDTVSGGAYGTHTVINYKRIKLYNDRAVKRWGDVELPYFSEMKMSLSDISARTILPDGSITDVPGSSIFDSTLSKTGRSKIKVKKFAFPKLAPGAIIEFQYTENYTEYLPRYIKLPVQLEIPAWEVIYYVKPLQSPYFPYEMRYYPFNCNPSKWEPAEGAGRREGYVVSKISSVPAFMEEPRMPAEDDVKAWILLYYTESSQDKADKYWKSLGRTLSTEFKRDVKVTGEMKTLAAELTAQATSVEAKAAALFTFCQTKIGNVSYNAEGMTSEERDRYYKKLYKPEYNSADTLKNKLGTRGDIVTLFFALAQAVGLDPIYVRSGSANGASFRPDFFDSYLLGKQLVAIREGEKLHYFNPGIPYLPPGMLHWDEQGQPALLADKEAKLVLLPPSKPEATIIHRNAKLTLTAEGHLKGAMLLQYFGHAAVAEKFELEDQSAGSREEAKKKELEAQFPGAQITNLTIENANSPRGTLTIRFQIAMENYAERTGKRIFFQPSLFQRGQPVLFSSANRINPINFRHAYEERDSVTIELPEGFALENPEMPGSFTMGEIGKYELSASLARDKPVLTLTRRFSWGQSGIPYFAAKAYPALKQAFTQIHEADTHSLTLRAK